MRGETHEDVHDALATDPLRRRPVAALALGGDDEDTTVDDELQQEGEELEQDVEEGGDELESEVEGE